MSYINLFYTYDNPDSSVISIASFEDIISILLQLCNYCNKNNLNVSDVYNCPVELYNKALNLKLLDRYGNLLIVKTRCKLILKKITFKSNEYNIFNNNSNKSLRKYDKKNLIESFLSFDYVKENIDKLNNLMKYTKEDYSNEDIFTYNDMFIKANCYRSNIFLEYHNPIVKKVIYLINERNHNILNKIKSMDNDQLYSNYKSYKTDNTNKILENYIRLQKK